MTRDRLVLSVTVLLTVVGGIVLAFTDRTLPDALIALAAGALGRLSNNTDGTQSVKIEPGAEPLPVTPTEPTPPSRKRAR